MLTEPHTYKGIQFMFHALYITFDTIHTIRIPYTSVQSCSSYLNPYTSCNSIQFHFIVHAIQFILSMQFMSFSYYYFILVYVVLFFWSLLSHISLSPIVLSITSQLSKPIHSSISFNGVISSQSRSSHTIQVNPVMFNHISQVICLGQSCKSFLIQISISITS